MYLDIWLERLVTNCCLNLTETCWQMLLSHAYSYMQKQSKVKFSMAYNPLFIFLLYATKICTIDNAIARNILFYLGGGGRGGRVYLSYNALF